MTEEDNAFPEAEVPAKDVPYKGKDKKEKGRSFTKIICRRLPPTMTEESFLEQVSPIPEHDYFYFAKPDMSLTPDLFSRAYINFVNVDDIFIFRDKFDDYIFLDEKGNEFPAIVEYAPFQRMSKKRRKKDPKSGTLESDPTYLDFLETLKETDSDCREPKMEYSFQLTEEKKETTTPLLEFLASKRRDEKRRKEERQRRRVRNRNSKEEDIIEEDVKKIKPRDIEKVKESAKSSSKKKEEVDQADSKDNNITKIHKTSKEQIKSTGNSRKKGEYGEMKLNRKERRERQREAVASKLVDKGKDGKKPDDFKKDKVNQTSTYRQIDEEEQDEMMSSTVESNVIQMSSPVEVKSPLVSSNIKPFTQLPQYKTEDLNKVIQEMDKNVTKKDRSTSEGKLTKEANKETFKMLSNEDIDSSLAQQRRNSLESGDIKVPAGESPLRRHKSLDDKSQDDSSGKEGLDKDKSSENKKERRVRNKDRPSIVIYQPGMGKFSKQRIDRTKDTSTGSYKPLDPTP